MTHCIACIATMNFYYNIVCVKFLTKFYQRLEEKGTDKTDTEIVEEQFTKFCKETRNDKEERFVSSILFPLNYLIAVLCSIVLLHWWFSHFSNKIVEYYN